MCTVWGMNRRLVIQPPCNACLHMVKTETLLVKVSGQLTESVVVFCRFRLLKSLSLNSPKAWLGWIFGS